MRLKFLGIHGGRSPVTFLKVSLTLAAAGFCTAVSITSANGADNEKTKFQVRPASEYSHRLTSEKVTIAAEPFETDEQTREAFGKVNPYRYGLLPVLIVISNDGPDAIRLDRMKLLYQLPDGRKIEATAPEDVKFIHGARQPKPVSAPMGGVRLGKSPKNPLAGWEIEGRALKAQMLPPGQSASGFVYFQVEQSSRAASVYISGLEDPAKGRQLYFFEIPMS